MKSIYHLALGESFHKLHPEMQKKFGLISKQKIMILGQGRMTEIRGTPAVLRPILMAFVPSHVMFAERGRNIPFTLENYAYEDEQGREKVSWIRRFFFPYAIRGFDAVMHYDSETGKIVDDLGKSGTFQTELDLEVTPEGGLLMQSNAISYKGKYDLSGIHTSVYEHFDEEQEAFRVHVHVEHPWFGTLLMYEGLVHTEYLPMTYSNIPDRGILV